MVLMTKESDMTNQTRNPGAWRWGLAVGLLALAGALQGCGGGGGGSPGVCTTALLQASWTITGNGAPLSCAQAGASEVDIIVDAMEKPFTCEAHSGVTPDFPPGTHSVTLELRDSSQNVLSRLGPMDVSFACGDVVDLGTVEVSLTP